MKNVYLLSFVTIMALYNGCGSAEVRLDGKVMSGLNVEEYSTKSGFNRNLNTKFITNFTTEGSAVDIALSSDGKVAYIASGSGGLEIIDISNPRDPKYISSYNLDEYINHVEVIDNKIYASYVTENTKAYKNISVYDISNPYRPIYLGTNEYRSSVAHYQVEYNGYIFEVDDYGLKIYYNDGSFKYTNVSSYPLGDHAYALAIDRGYIYIANGRDGLVILKSDIVTNEGSFID